MGGKIFRIPIFTVIAVAMLWSLSMGKQIDDSTRSEIFDNFSELTEKYDFMRAIAFVQGLGDPQDVSKTYENLVLDYYWKDKSLADVIAVARAGLQYCLTEAERMKKENPEKAIELKTAARRISYNLASFTWPGWAEKELIITVADIVVGLDAARLNLRLVKELNEGDGPLSVAYWGLGAQLLAMQQYDEALQAFIRSKEHAHGAGEKLSELLADGFVGVTMIVSGDSDAGRDTLGEAVKKLNEDGSEDALFYMQQFNTALDVFVK